MGSLTFHGYKYNIVETKDGKFQGEIFDGFVPVPAWITYPYPTREEAIEGSRRVIKRVDKGQDPGCSESLNRLQKEVLKMCLDPRFKEVVESLVRMYRYETKKK